METSKYQGQAELFSNHLCFLFLLAVRVTIGVITLPCSLACRHQSLPSSKEVGFKEKQASQIITEAFGSGMGHDLPIGIIKFMLWDMSCMKHPIREIVEQKIYQHQSKFGGVLKCKPRRPSKYQWEKPWFGVPIFWGTPWAPGSGLLHLARDTGHLHETAQFQGKEQRLLSGVAGSHGKFFGKVQTRDLQQKQL